MNRKSDEQVYCDEITGVIGYGPKHGEFSVNGQPIYPGVAPRLSGSRLLFELPWALRQILIPEQMQDGSVNQTVQHQREYVNRFTGTASEETQAEAQSVTPQSNQINELVAGGELHHAWADKSHALLYSPPETLAQRPHEVVIREGDPFEVALKKFTRRAQQDEVLSETKRRRHYEPPSVKRKRKADARERKARKRQAKLAALGYGTNVKPQDERPRATPRKDRPRESRPQSSAGAPPQ